MTPSLFSRTRQISQCWIRPATNDDWLAIERLLYYADRHYLALEWWTIQEWLGNPALLLSTDRHGRPLGLMLATTGNGPVAWLRAIAVAADECLKPLLAASAQAVLAQGGTGLAFLGSESWVLLGLKQVGFRQVNRVVTLRCRGDWSSCPGPSDLQVRAATAADLDDILVVDNAAFAPMWWYSREILCRALNSAFCFDVAYLGDVCAGYQFSTLRMGRGHIVRLATCPELRSRGIGARLLSEAMTALDLAEVERITVNTQEDNLPSLRLYRRFDFAQVGEPSAVWFQSLAQK
jgi:ribosomal-protein-alanine N-acetyltransferase